MTASPVEGPATVQVEVQMGRVEVVAGDRTDVAVAVTPSRPNRAGDRRAAEATRIERVGERIVVKTPFRMRMLGPGDSVEVRVEVPAGTDLTVTVSYGSVQTAGKLGAVRADVSYGDLDVQAAQRFDLTGGHGDYRVGEVDGDAGIGIKSGSVHLSRVGGRLRVTGADGRIEIDALDGPGELSTSSGAIEVGTAASDLTVRAAYGGITVREAVRGAVRIDGSYGNVDVGVRGGTAVWLDVGSQHGVVRTDLAADAGPRDGEDTLELRVRTGYGSITVHRAVGRDRRRPGRDPSGST
ncbi:DUF4097 family beta strand repeat-containing protein [Microbacterium luticocti]|uniref:DUF4097 family beta strand repeat-containing protein n=1 Tax=Microbacterium luticocti TaxID=451764 RepID=UPI000686A0FB|nr:DUF4097 family beta strand repeat-containing protein [Microbacterium luticocti]